MAVMLVNVLKSKMAMMKTAALLDTTTGSGDVHRRSFINVSSQNEMVPGNFETHSGKEE